MTDAEPLLARINAKRITHDDPSACRLWIGGTSLSGRRNVRYPIIRVFSGPGRARRDGGRRPMMRVTRLLLILKHGPTDCPRDDVESFENWLARCIRHYAEWEAAHTCD